MYQKPVMRQHYGLFLLPRTKIFIGYETAKRLKTQILDGEREKPPRLYWRIAGRFDNVLRQNLVFLRNTFLTNSRPRPGGFFDEILGDVLGQGLAPAAVGWCDKQERLQKNLRYALPPLCKGRCRAFARRRDCRVRFFSAVPATRREKQSPSRLRRQPPLHKGAFGMRQ